MITLYSHVTQVNIWVSGGLGTFNLTINFKGTFQGCVTLLIGHAIFECCVVSILLYGSENWFFNKGLLAKLEIFQV